MKVALVHDDLVQWGGAERVLVALSEIFPDAPIYTSVYDDNNKLLRQYFYSKKIFTSFIQKIPNWRSLYKLLLPLYPLSFEQFDFSGYDLVISQTTRFAKSIITKPGTKHLCYCHTPPRFLWNLSGEKSHPLLQPYLSFLRLYDRVVSKRADLWIAGSFNAQKRLKKIYDLSSVVIHPFVDNKLFSQIDNFKGGYLLVICRLNYYKRVDLVIEAANYLKVPLKIIGVGPQRPKLESLAGSTIEFLGMIEENCLLKVLSGCKALVVAGEEDFGLTALEAQAVGKPVIAYKSGGSLETVIEGETGYFFKDQTVESLIAALQALDKKGYNQKRCFEQAHYFSKEKFKDSFGDLVAKYER